MARYTHQDQFTIQGINGQLEQIDLELRKMLSREGETPNAIESDIDFNSKRLYNLPEALTETEPLRKKEGEGILEGATAEANRAKQEADRAADRADDARASANASAASAGNSYNSAQEADDAADRADLYAQQARGYAGTVFASGKVVPVDGVKSLQAFEDNLVSGLIFDAVGFYPTGTDGGDLFRWEADEPETSHDGGMVIALNAIKAWDGTDTDLSTLTNFSGTGTGCFVRIKQSSEVYLEDFGVTEGDFVSDAIEAAFKYSSRTFRTVKGMPNKVYKVSNNMNLEYLDFDGNGSTLRSNAIGDLAIVGSTELVLATSLSSDYTPGLGNSVALTSTAGIQRGDIISIVNNEIFSPAREHVYKKGMTTTVTAVGASAVNMQDAIPFSMLALNSRVIVVRPSKKPISIKNLTLDSGLTTDQTRGGFTIVSSVNPKISNVSSDGFGDQAISFRQCVGPEVDGLYTGSSFFTGSEQSYGVTFISCTRPVARKVVGHTGRKTIATGAASTGLPGITNGDARGAPVFDLLVDSCSTFPEVDALPSGSGDEGLDCHEGTYSVTIRNSQIFKFQVFANFITFDNCTIYGRSGEASLLTFVPTYLSSKISFRNTKFEGNGRIRFIGMPADVPMDMHVEKLEFIDCESTVNPLLIQPYIDLRDTSQRYSIGELILDNTKDILVRDHNREQIRIDHLTLSNIKDEGVGHYIPDSWDFGTRMETMTIKDCFWAPGFHSINASPAKQVTIENLLFNGDTSGNFTARFGDDSQVFILNTRLNFGSSSVVGLRIDATGGGGKWSSINAPRQFRTGSDLTTFATVNNLWPA